MLGGASGGGATDAGVTSFPTGTGSGVDRFAFGNGGLATALTVGVPTAGAVASESGDAFFAIGGFEAGGFPASGLLAGCLPTGVAGA
jgi:hypothetical protein